MNSLPRFRVCGLRRRMLLCLGVLAVAMGSLPLQAQLLVRQVNLSHLTQHADVIVQGKVTEVRYENLPGYSNIPTVVVTLQVENMLRGSSEKTYTFREVIFGLRSKPGKRAYKVGQRLLLFMPTPSRYGLSSPIGIEQGRFHIVRDRSGSETVVNERGNAGLFKSVEQAASSAGIQLTTSQSKLAATQRGPVPLSSFVSLVKQLTSLPRIQ